MENNYEVKNLRILLTNIFNKYLGKEGKVLASKIIAEMESVDPMYVISNYIEKFTCIIKELRDLKYLLFSKTKWRCLACDTCFTSMHHLLRHISVSNDERYRRLRSKLSLIRRKIKLTKINVLKDFTWIEL